MAMMSVYIVILVFSAYLTSYLGARTLARLARTGGFSAEYSQMAITLSMIGFLTVVSMATGVLLAALLLTAMGVWVGADTPTMRRNVVLALLAAVVLTTIGVWESPGAWPASVPLIGWLVLSALVTAASLFATRGAELSVPVLSGVALAAALPLILAPLLFPAVHGSMALDAAILLAALLGGLVVLPQSAMAARFLRLPLAALLAYGAIQAMHYGAWPLGAVSLLIWLAGVKLAPRALPAGM